MRAETRNARVGNNYKSQTINLRKIGLTGGGETTGTIQNSRKCQKPTARRNLQCQNKKEVANERKKLIKENTK